MKRGRKPAKNPEIARRILAAAENQFAAQGLAGARTDEIASAARASKAMLDYYFGASSIFIAPCSKISSGLSVSSSTAWRIPRIA